MRTSISVLSRRSRRSRRSRSPKVSSPSWCSDSLVRSEAGSREEREDDGGNDGAADTGVEHEKMHRDCARHGASCQRSPDLRGPRNEQQQTSDALERTRQVAEPVAEADLSKDLHPY